MAWRSRGSARSICATPATPTIRGRSTRQAHGRRPAAFSRAYLHHLVKSGETLGAMLLSEINIAYYQRLMHGIRDAIAHGTFADFRERTRAGWAQGDIAPR